jgi:hypothetical protein
MNPYRRISISEWRRKVLMRLLWAGGTGEKDPLGHTKPQGNGVGAFGINLLIIKKNFGKV